MASNVRSKSPEDDAAANTALALDSAAANAAPALDSSPTPKKSDDSVMSALSDRNAGGSLSSDQEKLFGAYKKMSEMQDTTRKIQADNAALQQLQKQAQHPDQRFPTRDCEQRFPSGDARRSSRTVY